MIFCIALSVITGTRNAVATRAFQNEKTAPNKYLSPNDPRVDYPSIAPDTTAATFEFSNTANISIPSSGVASLYPSSINVTGIPATVDKVTVTLNSLTHTWVSDLDILLVSPSGQSLILMSDAGGNNPGVSNVKLTFDDAATLELPTLPPTGTYKPTNIGTGDTFAFPAPGGPYQSPAPAGTATLTSTFGGTTPNGLWSLYVVDDTGGDAGILTGGWTLTITNTVTSQNTQAIPIPDSGPSSVYPSNVLVSGLIGSVTSTTVILNNFNHTAPNDVDLLLVAPGGRSVVLMSDVGGSIPASNVNLTIDDIAATNLPPDGPLVTGTFKATNNGAGDAFPAPAPAGPPTGDTLSVLNGINPNGNWGLYLVDDNGNNAGSLTGGWSIAISTSTTSCFLNLAPNLLVVPYAGGSGDFEINSPFGCDWTAVAISSWITITSATSGAGGLATLTFDVEPNMLGGRNGIIRVSNATQTRDFGVQQPSGCPFSLSETTQQFSASGGPGNVNVTAAGLCGWNATTSNNWIVINSGPGSGDGSVSFTVAPNTSSNPRTGTVQIGARTLTINQARLLSGAKPFDFDGDGKTDVSVFRPSSTTWHISQSSNGSAVSQQFGLSSDRLSPADYDGDDKVDVSVFRDGTWYIIRSSDSTFVAEQWGIAGDIPVPADYDGDDKADLAVFRSGDWYVKRSSDGQFFASHFGAGGDGPLPGDFDNDGQADLTVYRPGSTAVETSTWYVLRTTDGGITSQEFGLGEDVPVPSDYNGDGAIDFAVFRPSNGTWFAFQVLTIQWGTSGDVPVAGDYDGDGKADVAVFRQGVWYIRQSTDGTLRAQTWGTTGDVAIPSVFVTN